MGVFWSGGSRGVHGPVDRTVIFGLGPDRTFRSHYFKDRTVQIIKTGPDRTDFIGPNSNGPIGLKYFIGPQTF